MLWAIHDNNYYSGPLVAPKNDEALAVHFLHQASPSRRGDVEDAGAALPRLRQFAYHTEQQTVLGRGQHTRRTMAGVHYSMGPGMRRAASPELKGGARLALARPRAIAVAAS